MFEVKGIALLCFLCFLEGGIGLRVLDVGVEGFGDLGS